MTPTNPSRRGDADDATAPIDPAIEASADRAAIERDPAAGIDPVEVAPIPAADVPAPDATVLVEPTLIAEPNAPQPIVTASPVLATEPSAVDVVQADAAAARVAAGIGSAADIDAPHLAAAGQPTLAIEGGTVGRVGADPARDAPSAQPSLDPAVDQVPGDPVTVDAIVRGLEQLSLADPIGLDIVRTRFFQDGAPGQADRATERPASSARVAVIEVVGPAQGRRRAGRSFGPQPQRFLAGELTDDELAALRADPQLAVGISEVEADAFGYPIPQA